MRKIDQLPAGITLPEVSLQIVKLIKTRPSKFGLCIDNWPNLTAGQQQHLKDLNVVHSPNFVVVLTEGGAELLHMLKNE